MTGDLFGLDTFLVLLLLLVWSIAGSAAGRLAAAPAERKLRRRASGALIAIVLGGLLIAAKLVSSHMSWPSGWWPVQNKLIVQLPLLVLPGLAALLLAVPRLWKLARRPISKPNGGPDGSVRRAAADPLLVWPVQMTAIGAAFMLYYSMFTSVPLHGLADIALPLAGFAIVSALLAFRQRKRRESVSRPEWVGPKLPIRLLRGTTAVIAFAVGLAGVLALGAQASRLPDRIAMSDSAMDYGGGPEPATPGGAGHTMHAGMSHSGDGTVSVTELVGPKTGTPDRRFALTAEKKQVRLASGAVVDGWTFNGQLPGPELRMRQGELIEVTLANKDIEEGVTIHWHGLDVPNGEDGVAGVTQDAVLPGQTFVYRFRAEQTGTYWYHSHQQSLEEVAAGLFGALIVEPADSPLPEQRDMTVVHHQWNTSNGKTAAFGLADTLTNEAVPAGTKVRLRLVNADTEKTTFRLTGTPFKVAAIDGTDINEPTELQNAWLHVAAGGRYDVTFTMPSGPVLLDEKDSDREGDGDKGEQSYGPGLLLSADGKAEPPTAADGPAFDPLTYGTPKATPFGPGSRFDRSFAMVIDKKLGFFDGSFKYMYTINGELFPYTPMFMVREGELVKTTFVNRSYANHPMHLHGHHMLVLSRNGVPSTGSPWWTDTLNVGPGETYEIAFRADNPGVWMDHCHDLQHASAGMVLHLAYEGVTTPFEVGRATVNDPE